MKKYPFYLPLFITFLFSPPNPAQEIEHPFDYNQSAFNHTFLEFEKCDCSNNTFTKHLTEPYEEEIIEWQIQTSLYQKQLTEAEAACTDCTEKELSKQAEDKEFSHFAVEWFKELKKTLKFSQEPTPYEPIALPGLSTIPEVCFQISSSMINNTGESDRFFTCIRHHYDGSDEDHLCYDTSEEVDSPKKCNALPLSCEDTNNNDIACLPKYRERPKQEKEGGGCNKGAVYPRRPCLNLDYISITAKAFHDVAKCLSVRPKLAFSILHHESRFLINNESPSGALCHTQVTGNAVEDFNSFLEGKSSHYSIEALNPKIIAKKCPKAWKHFNKVEAQLNKNEKGYFIKTEKDKCKLNTNPYTCFFYGLAYIKIIQNLVVKNVENLNTIELAEESNVIMIFKDEAEKNKTEAKLGRKVKSKKVPIFPNEEELIRILTIIGYNGGTSIPIVFFKDYITNLKGSLSNKNNYRLRTTFLSRAGLSSEFFTHSFTKYLLKEYKGGARRKSEVANYLKKIKRDGKSLGDKIQEKYPKSFPKDICPK